MDKKQKKALKRAQKKKKLKKEAQETQAKVGRKMEMFNKLPENCSICGSSFPKTKEAHMSWQVKVWSERQEVTLVCPPCLAEK